MFGPNFFSFTCLAIFLLPMSLLSMTGINIMCLPPEVARLRAGLKKKRILKIVVHRAELSEWVAAHQLQLLFSFRWFRSDSGDGPRRKGRTARTLQKVIYSRIPLKKVFFTFNHVYVFYQTRDMYLSQLIGVAKLVPHTVLTSTVMSI